MSKEENFLNYVSQFNELDLILLSQLGNRFDLTVPDMQVLLVNNNWHVDAYRQLFIHPNKKDQKSLLDNTDFKSEKYNTKKIPYKRK